MTGPQDTDLPAGERRKLLQQSLQVIGLAENVGTDAAAPEGWKVIASSRPDEAGGGFFGRIYARTGKGTPHYAAAFRGTDSLADMHDLDADMEIAFRRLPDQYWQALSFVQNTCAAQNIDATQMLFTGHSLGGYLARTVAATLGANDVWTFNSPGPTEKIRDALVDAIPGASTAPQHFVQIRSAYDIVSLWGFQDGKIVSVETAGSHHGLASLHHAITQTLAGEKPKPLFHRAPLSLSRIFSAFSRRLAQSAGVDRTIKRLVSDPADKKTPRPH